MITKQNPTGEHLKPESDALDPESRLATLMRSAIADMSDANLPDDIRGTLYALQPDAPFYHSSPDATLPVKMARLAADLAELGRYFYLQLQQDIQLPDLDRGKLVDLIRQSADIPLQQAWEASGSLFDRLQTNTRSGHSFA